jgi:uncharacterized repeat protein (TIGR03847 family)
MPTIVHGFDWPDRIVVGTIGQPGSREFYLQTRAGSHIVSVGLEKEQSALLAEKIEEILDELMATEGNPFSIPSATPVELVDNDPLEQPIEPAFQTAAISLGWDPTTVQVVIEAYPFVESDDSEPDLFEPELDEIELPEMLQVRIPVGTARAFAKRTLEVVGAGRPLCPLCGAPMDADGHVCENPSDF